MTRVLIIDDDEALSSVIGDFLRAQGFEATWTASAEDAYDILGKQPFDAILLDINLPGDSGFDTCRTIRSFSNVPILFASARTSIDDEVDALDMGGDDYLSKPYSLKELLAHLKALLRRAGSGETGQHVTAGDVEIDMGARSVTKAGAAIALSPKEFDVLACLAKRAGDAVPTTDILSEAWGVFSEVEPSTVSVHVRWLREKLEDDPAHPQLIKTIRKVGYALATEGEAQNGEAS